MSADACRPRIFVHELPPDYRDSQSDQRAFSSQPYPNGRSNHLAGSSVLPHFPPHVRLWNSGQFSNAELMYQRALAHECRVRNESLADLFFIPAFSGALRAASVSAGEHCAERGATHKPGRSNAELQSIVSASGLIKRLRSVAAPHCGSRTLRRGAAPTATDSASTGSTSTDSASCSVLEARGGADHVIVNPRNGAVFESHPFCELDYLDPRLGNAVRLSIEEPPRGRWEWFDHYQSHPAYVGIPHISMVHLQRNQLSDAPWRSRHPRPQLAVGAFGVRGPRQVRKLREALRSSCQAAPPTDCYFFHTSDAFNKNKTQRFSWESKWHSRTHPNLDSHSHALQPEKDPLWITTAKLYWNATFCLQPPGDAVSRKGVADALVLGCIPVQFHEGMAEQWPWHWGEWQRASSVLLDWRAVLRGELDIMEALRGIPAAQVAAMQESIAQNAHRIHYSQESLAHGLQAAPRLDAFDTVMQRAWEHAQNESNARKGRHMQRRQGEEVQSVADELMREPKQHTGYCGHAQTGMGDCGRGKSGRLPLIVAKPARVQAAHKGARATSPSLWQDRGQSLASVDDCVEYCQRCGQCRYISYSLVTMTCEWYRDCNTTLGLHARSYSLWHTFRTRRVK